MRSLFVAGLMLVALLPIGVADAHGRGHRERSRHDRSYNSGGRSCSRETRSCSWVLSRSQTAALYERLESALIEHMDKVEKMAARVCRRAENSGDCESGFVAGLWNGLDALEVAIAEGSCGTLKIRWSKTDGLSQEWDSTDGPECRD